MNRGMCNLLQTPGQSPSNTLPEPPSARPSLVTNPLHDFDRHQLCVADRSVDQSVEWREGVEG